MIHFLSLAIATLRTRRLRTLFSITGFALAVCGLVSLLSISRGLSVSVGEYYERIDGMYAVGKGSLDPVLSSLPASLETSLNGFEGIRATPEIWCFAFTVDGKNALSKGILSFVTVGGVDVEKTSSLPEGGVYFRSLTQGRLLSASDTDHALVSERLAGEYGKTVGSIIRVNNRDLTVVGLYRTGSIFLDSALIVPLETGYLLSRKDRDKVSSYYVVNGGAVSDDEIADELMLRFPDLEIKRSSTWMDDFGGIISNIDSFISTIIVFTIAISAIIILNTMMMNVSERRRDFGIMLSEGWTRIAISCLVLIEALLLSGAGCLAGNILSLAVHAVLLEVLPFTPVLTVDVVAGSFLLAAGVGAAGGVLPVTRLSSIRAAEVLRVL